MGSLLVSLFISSQPVLIFFPLSLLIGLESLDICLFYFNEMHVSSISLLMGELTDGSILHMCVGQLQI